MHKEVRVIASRIAVFALALSSCTALAQKHAKVTLTVVVTDQSGAIIPGAYIAATNQATGSRFEAPSDANGQAVVDLNEGTYKLTVTARGFQQYTEKDAALRAETHKKVVLSISNLVECGPCVSLIPVADVREIPSEHQPIAAEIPLIPMQQFVPLAKPYRPKHASDRRNHT
jgi:hypothetical protein